MNPVHRMLRLVLVAAIFFYFAVPLVLASGRAEQEHSRPSQVHSRVVKSAVLLLKDITVNAACVERVCTTEASRLSLNAVATMTRCLDRVGALSITILDVPVDGRLSSGR